MNPTVDTNGDHRGLPAQTPPLLLRPARRWRVLLSFGVDTLVLCCAGVGATSLELALRRARFETSFHAWYDIASEWLYVNVGEVQHGIIVALVVGLVFGTRPGGRTPGRIATGIILVRASGRPFNGWAWALRVTGLLISTGALGFGFLWAFFDPDSRTAHDVLAGTVSVRRTHHRSIGGLETQ